MTTSQRYDRIAFVAEPTGHLMGQFIMQPVGAGFTARNDFNTLASDDELRQGGHRQRDPRQTGHLTAGTVIPQGVLVCDWLPPSI